MTERIQYVLLDCDRVLANKQRGLFATYTEQAHRYLMSSSIRDRFISTYKVPDLATFRGHLKEAEVSYQRGCESPEEFWRGILNAFEIPDKRTEPLSAILSHSFQPDADALRCVAYLRKLQGVQFGIISNTYDVVATRIRQMSREHPVFSHHWLSSDPHIMMRKDDVQLFERVRDDLDAVGISATEVAYLDDNFHNVQRGCAVFPYSATHGGRLGQLEEAIVTPATLKDELYANVSVPSELNEPFIVPAQSAEAS